jgi:hypothetical protein
MISSFIVKKGSPLISSDVNYQNNEKIYKANARGNSSERRIDDRTRGHARRPSNESNSSSAYRNSPGDDERGRKITRLEQQLKDSEKHLRESEQVILDLEKKLESQIKVPL